MMFDKFEKFCMRVLLLVATISSVLLVGLLLMALSSAISRADTVDLDELSVDYKSFFDGGRDPLITSNGIPGRQMNEELSLNVDTTIASVFYWNSIIHSMTDRLNGERGQFRVVGLLTRFGLRVTQGIEFGLIHHSQHLLDASLPYGYPENDALELKIFLYRKLPGKEVLFK